MEYVMNTSTMPSTCFPKNLRTDDFIDITTVQDSWKRFLDPETGKIHDCGEYYDAAIKQLEDL